MPAHPESEPRPVVRHGDDVPEQRWDDPRDGTIGFRTLFGDGAVPTAGMTAAVCSLEPGERLGRHSHEALEVYFVMRGGGTLHLGDERHEVRAGPAAHLPGGCVHGIENNGSARLEFFSAHPVDAFDEVVYSYPDEGSGRPGERTDPAR